MDTCICGVSETHLVGKGVWDMEGNEVKLWNGWVAWSGVNEGYKGRKREGVAVLMAERMKKYVGSHGCVNLRLVWCEYAA